MKKCFIQAECSFHPFRNEIMRGSLHSNQINNKYGKVDKRLSEIQTQISTHEHELHSKYSDSIENARKRNLERVLFCWNVCIKWIFQLLSNESLLSYHFRILHIGTFHDNTLNHRIRRSWSFCSQTQLLLNCYQNVVWTYFRLFRKRKSVISSD